MKYLTLPFVAAFALAVPFAFISQAAAEGPRDALWKEVDAAMKKDRPKTAVEKLKPIIAGAVKDKAWPEAVKAIGKKISFEGQIQGHRPEEKIRRLEAEIPKAAEEMRPMLHTIMATWYWHYFQNNRWRFLQRTRTAAAPGDDIETWDLPRILAEIDKWFGKALASEAQLLNVPIAQWDDLLSKGNVPDAYRPTLFDFTAHEALRFYTTGEQAGARAQDAFDLSADSPVFGSPEEFMGWKIESADDESLTVKALELYQRLMAIHKDDNDESACIDADLGRLVFGNNKAFGEEKAKRFKAGLKRFIDKNADHQISARARHELAKVLQGEGELVEARKIAMAGFRAFPESVGGSRCYNLIQQIEAMSVQLHVERVWNNPWPSIHVKYRNLNKVHFRIVADDWKARLKKARRQPENLDDKERNQLLSRKPVKAWSAGVPATDDYRERVEKVEPPKGLKPGFYFLVASTEAGFSRQKQGIISMTHFWVSDLALVMRQNRQSATIEGFVLNALSGQPAEGADVEIWKRDRNRKYLKQASGETDANGLFRLKAENQRSHRVFVTSNGQSLASANDYSVYTNSRKPNPSLQTWFFTDRSLYRPGQTIQFKGICIRSFPQKNEYDVLPNQNVTIAFQDPNGKEIEKLTLRTNDYGSLSGSVTAPRDRVMGRMRLRVVSGPNGSGHFNVEEYKRPKFEVAIEPPEVAAKLGGKVTLLGKATAYTGAAIDGAKVRYRVVREVRWPAWWGWYCWWGPPRQGTSQEIDHGSARTATDGSFEVTFTAKPDLTVDKKGDPTFVFTVHADVTDNAGETRSDSHGIRLGYKALEATLSAHSDWQTAEKPVKLTIRTATLDGVGQRAQGVVKIHKLKQPEKVQRARMAGPSPMHGWPAALRPKPEPDLSNTHSWELGEVAVELPFATDANGDASLDAKLGAGAYRAVLETKDRFENKVTAMLPVSVLEPDAAKLHIKVPNLVAAPSWSLEPGETFAGLWGSGYGAARAFIEIEHRGKIVNARWTDAQKTQARVMHEVTEKLRGGFTLHVTMVRENRAYLTTRKVEVPWTNKNLKLSWEHFVSKLEPAQKETWTAVITGPDAKKAVAEMAAALYDESLDAYLPHSWRQSFGGVFHNDRTRRYSRFENNLQYLQAIHHNYSVGRKDGNLRYRAFPHEITQNLWGWGGGGRPGGRPGLMMRNSARGMALPMESAGMAPGTPMAEASPAKSAPMDSGVVGGRMAANNGRGDGGQGGSAAAQPKPNLEGVTARKNLNETAFFFPKLVSAKSGEVRIEFTMPEALTRWKFLGFAHDKKLRSGFLTASVVTAKDLMVQPNPPRFLREGDVLEFTVKVTNQSDAVQKGTARLTFADVRTAKSVDADLGNEQVDRPFEVPAKESRSIAWRISVPDGMGFLTYKAVAATDKLSDGEEGYLPVLSRRILVTESLPLPIRGKKTKKFSFKKLGKSGESDTLRHEKLVVQMVSNPSWYAVMALPYLMEFPHECAEQIFNRLYANSLGRHIAQSDPKIRRVFDQWRGTKALDSPLEKNQDLKAVMLDETPWRRQADNESQARRNVGILFEDNRLNDELGRAARQLKELQLGNGAWPWFPGGRANDYITLYITTGYARLRHLDVEGVDMKPALKAVGYLDGWVDKIYREILRNGKKEECHLTSTIALYLYCRSFYINDVPVKGKPKEAIDYFLGQGKKFWTKLKSRQSRAHLALAMKRFGSGGETPRDIMISIKEHAVTDQELGMFWRDLEFNWWWFRAPIETQAMMIEAFDEIMNDKKAVEECKVWLLKQKQTQDWKTTKATADAVYALLLRGADLLASDELVEVSLGGNVIEPENVEAGTGFYEKRFAGAEVKPAMSQVTVKKVDEGVAWGAVHWQYLEDMSKVTPHEGTPLKLKKALFTRTHTKKGPVLNAVKPGQPLQVGDELVVRIELRTDRDMEYLHLKDHRGSGTEPVNVLSRYKYQDGLGYYESTRDTASHFFIDYLPKGVYVFEYAVRVFHKGEYQTGMANIQCMYAPEFNSHSESFLLEVK